MVAGMCHMQSFWKWKLWMIPLWMTHQCLQTDLATQSESKFENRSREKGNAWHLFDEYIWKFAWENSWRNPRWSYFQTDFALSHFFTRYGGVLSAVLRETKFRRSLLPQSGLEIPITLHVIKAESSEKVCSQMKNFVEKHYLELEKIPIKDKY